LADKKGGYAKEGISACDQNLIKEASMKLKAMLVGALLGAFGTIGLLGQPAATQSSEGAVVTGSWYLETVLPNNAGLCPSVVVFHGDGTVVASGCIALGGLPTNPYRYTPFQGVWERVGPHEFKATLYSLRFDGTSNLLVAVARKIDYCSFGDDFGHFAGTSHMSVLPCPAPPLCPDPQSAPESAWKSFNPDPTNPNATVTILPIYAARLSGVPY